MDAEGNPFYPVKVRTKEASLGENMPIIPGMTVQVDILTGKKSILSYLLKPVLRARQVAMTER
jgi:adhesin transport system membrane fusion protein